MTAIETLPDRRPRRSRRTMRRLRSPAHRVQLLSQSALSEMSVAGPCPVDRAADRRDPRLRVFPRRLHRAGGHRRHRVPEQEHTSTASSSARPPRRCAPSPPILSISAPRSVSSRCCTRGDRRLMHHPHLHCVVPGGGLSPDGTRWIACRPDFFLPVRVLSRLFRRLFVARCRPSLCQR